MRIQRESWMMLPLRHSEVHHFEYQDRTFLYDVHSGAFFEADDLILDVVQAADGRTLIELFEVLRDRHGEKDVFGAVRDLREEGILSEREIAPVEAPHPPTRLEITRLDLVVTTDTCDGTGDEPVRYLREDTGKQAIDTLIDTSGFVRDLQLAFVGGEPLLNTPLVLTLIDYAQDRAAERGKRVAPIVVTDGSCVNDRTCAELERRGAVIRLETSGTERRLGGLYGAGPSSLSTTDLEAREIDVHLRIEPASEPDTVSTIDAGLKRYPRARSVTIGPRTLSAASDETLQDLAQLARARWIQGQDVRFRELEDRMDQVASGRVAAYHDLDGLRTIAVDTDGAIYVSRHLIGTARFSLGHCGSGLDRERQARWIESTHVDALEGCRNCWARYLCAGGSRAHAYLANGDVRRRDESYCRSQRRLSELAIGLYADLSERYPELLVERMTTDQAA